jgi:hypothetical protein
LDGKVLLNGLEVRVMKTGILTLGFLLALTAFPRDREPAYDTATVVDVMGKVTDVWEVAPFMPLEGVHLTIESGSGTLDVYVGPADFVKIFGVTFNKDAKIEVIGSRVMHEYDDVVLAREIRIYDVTITLRDRDGRPYWTGWGRRPTG